MKVFVSKAQNIYDVFDPIHKVSSIFGLTSFTIKSKNKALKAYVLKQNVASLITSTSWSIFCIYYYISLLMESNGIKKAFSIVNIIFKSSSIFVNWNIMYNRREFHNAINLLISVDQKFNEDGYSTNFEKQKKVASLTVVFSTIFIIVSVICTTFVESIFGNYDWMFIFLSMVICLEHWSLMNFQLGFWMWVVKLKFEKLNCYLNEKFLGDEKSCNIEGNVKLIKAAQIYEKLTEVCKSINEVYGFAVRTF